LKLFDSTLSTNSLLPKNYVLCNNNYTSSDNYISIFIFIFPDYSFEYYPLYLLLTFTFLSFVGELSLVFFYLERLRVDFNLFERLLLLLVLVILREGLLLLLIFSKLILLLFSNFNFELMVVDKVLNILSL